MSGEGREKARTISVVADQKASRDGDGVHSTGTHGTPIELVEQAHHRVLVRHRDIEAVKAQRAQASYCLFEIFGPDDQWHVPPI